MYVHALFIFFFIIPFFILCRLLRAMCCCSQSTNGGSSANWVPGVPVYGSGSCDGGETRDSGLSSLGVDSEVSFPFRRRPSFQSTVPNLFDIGLGSDRVPLIPPPKREHYRRTSRIVLEDVTEGLAATLDNILPTSPSPEAAPPISDATPEGVPQCSSFNAVPRSQDMEEVPLNPVPPADHSIVIDEFYPERRGSESGSSEDMHENF